VHLERDAAAVGDLEAEQRADADLEVEAATDLQRQGEQRRLDPSRISRPENLLHEDAVRPAQPPREAQHAAEYRARTMSGLRVEPFSKTHVDDAAELLARRHERHLAQGSLLQRKPDFRAEVEQAAAEDGASGSVLVADGRVQGYLLGSPRPLTNTGLTWQVVGFAGLAFEGEAELVRDLYAHAASTWVDDGHTRHGVYVPWSEQDLVDAWFRLTFGASGITAARETAVEPFEAGLRVRDGTSDDLEAAVRLDEDMADSMRPAPSFSGQQPTSTEELLDEWRDTWHDERFQHFVAESEGRIVGHAVLYTGRSGIRIPEDSIDLAAASTESEARGTGVGRALTSHVLGWAHEQGYGSMTTDWRMTNLLASRFWPKRGFRPTFLRMYRSIP
jgi:GNAT superfamily N-acetyltransferase